MFPKRPTCSDIFPTSTGRKLEHYLERFWNIDDARAKLLSVQGGRMNDPVKKERSVSKMLETVRKKPLSEKLRINASKGNNYKDPKRMAERYNISEEDAIEKYQERTSRKSYNLKKTFREMGGYKREWSCKCVEYWLIRGYTSDEAKLKIKEISPDTRSINSIMARFNYTPEEAKLYFDEVTRKGIETFEKRPQWQRNDINLKRTRFSKKYSMASAKFFSKLINSLGLGNDITYRLNDREYFLWDYDNKKVYFYDFCIPELSIMIEYNGIMFHPRQRDTIFTTVAESVAKDDLKDKLAKDNGFDLHWYWENIDDEQDRLTYYKNLIIYKYDEYKNRNNAG